MAPAGGPGCAVKLPLPFAVFDQLPEYWTITPGNVGERKTWKGKAQPGGFYVADRLDSDDHRFLAPMLEPKIEFGPRLPGNVTRAPVEPARPLTPPDVAAGVVSDRLEYLGVREGGPVVRVAQIHAAGQVLVLRTSRQDCLRRKQAAQTTDAMDAKRHSTEDRHQLCPA